jgi:hypothetical protein
MPRIEIPDDPLARFREVYEALEEERGFFGDATALRFAAVTAIACPGSGRAVARAIRSTAEELKAAAGWFSSLRSVLRFIVSSLVVLNRDDIADLLAEIERVRSLFRSVKLRREATYETFAILIMRYAGGRQAITEAQVRRFQQIYEEMKTHHWWLTGPEDFPACGILVSRSDSPRAIGRDIESIYQAINARGFAKGDQLQTAANILYLAKGTPEAIARRFGDLAAGFKSAGVRIWRSDYDELAILCFLDHSAHRIVTTVQRHREALEKMRPRPGKEMSFDLASSLTFLELVSRDPDMRQITDAKALLDMQAILAAQQAAAAAAASSAAACAASS